MRVGDAEESLQRSVTISSRNSEPKDQFRKHDVPTIPAKLGSEVLAEV